ncbi:hypothetical protein HYH03_008304 [Edaphochlamys debaryana]|uniref:Uncharacterized protein n=1 Tax=Edaphochlamys debaryana TaxID=47281 RepID=A0A835Y061_9CHLO|nr:hypothetical protein HYH03_008304 [Edaphochlamys debaryana]|eukprot:KAG2493488.1 hypothetical protein HYH03_008304 [Edaphochlamys debaryana]
MAQPIDWAEKLNSLELSAAEKGQAVAIFMRMPAADREYICKFPDDVAKVAVMNLLMPQDVPARADQGAGWRKAEPSKDLVLEWFSKKFGDKEKAL